MNEWQLQKILTTRWLRDGLIVDGRLHFLAAWEVMLPSWQINDAHVYWSEPSIDFLGVDSDGGLLAAELKMRVPGVKPAWRVLCQVTHRAIMLRDTFTPERLQSAYRAAYSGRHGRVDTGDHLGIAEEHRRFFGGERLPSLGLGDVGRVVVATEFGPNFDAVLSEFNNLTEMGVQHTLEVAGLTDGSRMNREVTRLLSATEGRPFPEPPVCRLIVEP